LLHKLIAKIPSYFFAAPKYQMTMKSPKRSLVCFSFLLVVLLCLTAAQGLSLPVNIAFLSIDNLSANPRYDYLEGIIRALLLFNPKFQRFSETK